MPEEVLITNGGKQAIYNLCQVILNPNDEVIVPSPYWLSYPEIISLAGAKQISIYTSSQHNFELNIEAIKAIRHPEAPPSELPLYLLQKLVPNSNYKNNVF